MRETFQGPFTILLAEDDLSILTVIKLKPKHEDYESVPRFLPEKIQRMLEEEKNG